MHRKPTHRTRLFLRQLQLTFKLLQKNDPLRLAGATAFFANFALPPILLILIRLFGFFVDRRLLATRLLDRLAGIMEESSIVQIKDVLQNIRGVDHNWWATIISFTFFIFVATTLFGVIKNGMDQIWRIGVEKAGFLRNLKLRLRSMVIILFAGILFFVGLLTDSVQAFIRTYMDSAAPTFGKFFLFILNEVLFIAIVTVWFTILFRFLTNGRPGWSAAARGGLLTGILFNLGKYILRIMLPLSNIGNIYGASGSIVLIMLFVFYASLIFYFGVCFVKILSDHGKKRIQPIKGAFQYELTEVKSKES